MNAKEVCKNVDKRLRPQAETLFDQIIVMEKKLKALERQMPKENLTVIYDNGGGQMGTRENPFFPAYEKLLATYKKSLVTLRDMLGAENAVELKSLESIRAKFKVGS